MSFWNKYRRKVIIIASLVVGIFVIVNVGLALAYANRTYPGTKVMSTSIGSVAYSGLSQKVGELKLLPESITLQKDNQKATITLSDLGVSKDVSRTVDSAKKQRALIPIVNLFKSPQLEAPVKADTSTLNAKASELARSFKKDATDAHLVLTADKVTIADQENGYTLDQKSLGSVLFSGLDKGKTTIEVPTNVVPAKNKTSDLKGEKTALEAQLATGITFKYEGKTKQATAADISSWYSPSGATYVIDSGKLSSYLGSLGTQFGIRIKDVSGVIATVSDNLKARKTATVTVSAQVAVKTFHYCVGVRGVDTAHLNALRNKVKSTYADPRGWSLGGLVDFQEVSSGCDYTVWLSSASQMTSFGGVCDPIWSCRSGDNVVFNYDRWSTTSPAWQEFGGTLEDYRSMLINHETGHRLGFAHRHCGGAGQLAPVMQQQSIDLEGCKFNPWPVQAELDTFKATIGL
jgi:hypothetical protein